MIMTDEEVYENIRYISPVKSDAMNEKGWTFEPFPFGGGKYKFIILRINELRESHEVICGYMASNVRNYHVNFIIYK